MDEIGLYVDGSTKVAESKGKRKTVGAIKDINPGHLSCSLSLLERDNLFQHSLFGDNLSYLHLAEIVQECGCCGILRPVYSKNIELLVQF
ncbi:MAG: hypothetical protein EZS28_045540 [Streblomastix strix]|uniref:Uncharacterized protein n=1 Tax=Streblomastix strix TaxID=222440 RepID=A0A5J4TNB7_9EUKA|nr:MAG: hypothetical protein EZS28_045540 [Streblomastix strix]